MKTNKKQYLKLIKPLLVFVSCFYILVACNSFKLVTESYSLEKAKNALPLTDAEKKAWHFRDFENDSIPGASIAKAHDLVKNKQGKVIVVAVIDTELDIAQEELKNQIWTNQGEIPDNNIDDDNNGYIDDIHGWNYVGSTKDDDLPYSSYDYVRIIKKYDTLFKGFVSVKEVPDSLQKEFHLYQKAYMAYNSAVKKRHDEIARYKRIENRYNKGLLTAKKYFFDKDYDISKLDSLKEKLSDEEEIKNISKLSKYLEYEIDNDWIDGHIDFEKHKLKTFLNFDYNERYLTNDNTNDLNDIPYGNNYVQGIEKISHSTEVSSVIAAKRNDTLVEGINDMVKIMPLSISVAGNEHDKDIALAIRYAVDNGAKVINMSIGKDFSLHPTWVYDAIAYAAENEVLIVTSSGNDAYDLDRIENYPNDAKDDGIEFANNFIKVGNSSNEFNSKLVQRASNYGKMEVDIFAPGTKIPCLTRWRATTDTGTSVSSAVVSGIASLILSYYPNLTAAEVKEIIMESGISFDIMVHKPSFNKEKELVPFSSLSKSGKIINAYNALLLAEEVSSNKIP